MCKHHSDRHPSPPIWVLPVLALVVLGVVAALTGCAPPADSKPSAQINPAHMEYIVPHLTWVEEFHLIDGTRCVAMRSSLTCEWKQPVILVPRVE